MSHFKLEVRVKDGELYGLSSTRGEIKIPRQVAADIATINDFWTYIGFISKYEGQTLILNNSLRIMGVKSDTEQNVFG